VAGLASRKPGFDPRLVRVGFVEDKVTVGDISLRVLRCRCHSTNKDKGKVHPGTGIRLCTGLTAHRGSRGIALLFLDHGTRRGVRGQRHAPAALHPRERPGTHCTGGWMGPRVGLNRCGKSRLHRDSTPGPSSP